MQHTACTDEARIVLRAIALAAQAVLDERLAVTPISATSQLAVEALQPLGCVANQQHERHIAQRWTNVQTDY